MVGNSNGILETQIFLREIDRFIANDLNRAPESIEM